jgi:photosystem II stability/assembly factor-like uncharacterized protein
MRPDTIYAGYSYDILPGKLAISHDGGATWFERSVGQAAVYATYVPPNAASGVAYAGTDARVLRSGDGGLTWSPRGLDGELVDDLASPSSAPSTLFAATHSSGVMRTDDEGVTWTAWNDGLPTTDVRAVLVDGAAALVLCATEGAGVFARPLDGSAAWAPYPDAVQPFVPLVRDLALDGSGNVLCATNGAAIWRTPLVAVPSGITRVAEPARVMRVAHARHPEGGVDFQLSAPAGEPFTLRVFDTTGRVMWSRSSRTDAQGIARERWEAPGAPTALYLYAVARPDQTIRGRLLLLK